jgi:hypothetical protein
VRPWKHPFLLSYMEFKLTLRGLFPKILCVFSRFQNILYSWSLKFLNLCPKPSSKKFWYSKSYWIRNLRVRNFKLKSVKIGTSRTPGSTFISYQVVAGEDDHRQYFEKWTKSHISTIESKAKSLYSPIFLFTLTLFVLSMVFFKQWLCLTV